MAPPAPPTVEGDVVEGNAAQSAPTPQAEGGTRSWERPWTVSEMKKEANNWSLAGDAGLLQYLQEFSQKVISRTHEIGKEVDGLVHEAKLTEVRVNNVFNDFIMLANTQFVENRVYDEDVSQSQQQEEAKPDQEEKTREQREAELIPKVTAALRHGVQVIEDAFEKLDTNIDDSDSEDEEGGYRADPILEAKDLYVTRSLPVLIGSPAFLQDDNVGLMEDISEGELTDHGSISQSEEEETEYSDSDEEEHQRAKARRAKTLQGDSDETESEEESDEDEESDGDMFKKPKKQKVFDDDDEEEDSEESGSETEKANDEDTEKPTKVKGPAFASELAARIGAAVPKPQVDEDEDEGDDELEEKPKQAVKEKKKKESKKEKKHKAKSKHEKSASEDMFGGTVEEDDSSPFGKSGGMFTSSKGLFDDDDDQDSGGLFDDIDKPPRKLSTKKKVEESEEDEASEEDEEPVVKEPPRPRTASGKKLPPGAVSIFGEGDSGLFTSSIREEEEQPVPEAPPTKKASAKSKPAGGGGLFDDEDEEDDLFAGVPKKSQPKKESVTKTTAAAAKPSKPAGDLFAEDDEDEGDLFGGESAASTQKKAEAVPEETKPKAKKPEKKLPAGAVSMFGNALNPLTAAIKKQRQISESEEEKDTDDGQKSRSGSIKSSQSSSSLRGSMDNVKKSSRSPSVSSNSLFADDVDEDLFSTKPKTESAKPASKSKPAASVLFPDEEEEEQGSLFGTAPPAKSASKTVQSKKEAEKPRSGSLFDDGDLDDDDMFSFKSKPKDTGKKKPVGGVALFGGADILKKKPEPEEEEPKKDEPEAKPAAKPPPVKQTLSLFDEDEEGGDLFGTKPKTKAPAPAKEGTTRARGKSLFDDEDVLFGGAAEEAPGVDLFSNQGPLGESPKSEPAKAAPTKATGPPKAAPKPAAKPARSASKTSGSDLFGDDEEDDLFGAPKKDKAKEKVDIAGVTTTESSDTRPVEEEAKPAVSKPKKPAGAVSMFGGLDPSALLKKKKQPVEEDEEKPKADEKKPEPKKPADPLFGGDDEKAPDIFTVVAPKPKPPASAPKPVAPKPKPDEEKLEEKEIPAAETDVSKSEDGTGTTTEEVVAKPVRPKKLAGAVSMFGGMDPSKLGLKKKPSEEKDEPEDDAVPVPPELPDLDELAVPSTSPPPAKKIPGRVGKLQGGLGINPAALLPGAAPPPTIRTEAAVDFTEPVDAQPLASAAKDRAKIITRRRPQSRKARHSAALSGVFDDFSPTMSPTSPTTPSELPITQNGDVSSPSKPDRKDVLFGNDDILGDSAKGEPVLPDIKSNEKDVFSDGLFTKSNKPKKDSSLDDDLFAAKPASKSDKKVDDDLFTAKSSEKSADKKKAQVEDDDLFASKPKEKTKPAAKKGDDDDLFASSSKTTKSEKSDTKPEAAGGKVEKKEVAKKKTDDDDIFADSSINKKKDTKTKVAAAPEEDIFSDSSVAKKPADKSDAKKPADKSDAKQDDKSEAKKEATRKDDDIFATSSLEKKKPKKASVKDESLFKDDTDIFADIPAAKPKEPKKKKKTEKTEKKSIFKDDIDDIFADTSPVGMKPKKETKKKAKDTAKSPAHADDGDIFDDPLLGGK